MQRPSMSANCPIQKSKVRSQKVTGGLLKLPEWKTMCSNGLAQEEIQHLAWGYLCENYGT